MEDPPPFFFLAFYSFLKEDIKELNQPTWWVSI